MMGEEARSSQGRETNSATLECRHLLLKCRLVNLYPSLYFDGSHACQGEKVPHDGNVNLLLACEITRKYYPKTSS